MRYSLGIQALVHGALIAFAAAVPTVRGSYAASSIVDLLPLVALYFAALLAVTSPFFLPGQRVKSLAIGVLLTALTGVSALFALLTQMG